MVIPDDLPRSPTGRVPQWVIDEAFLTAVEARGSATDIAAQRAVVESLSADLDLLQDQLAVAG